MQSIAKLITILSCFITLAHSAERNPLKLPLINEEFLNGLLKSRQGVAIDGHSTTLECFTYYDPFLEEIHRTYRVSYLKCTDDETALRAQYDEDTQWQRAVLEEMSNEVIQAYAKCGATQSSADFYQCYQEAGNINVRNDYNITAIAQTYFDNLTDAYRNFETAKERCQSQCDRQYKEDWGRTVTELNMCLSGMNDVPTGESTPVPTNAPAETETEDNSTGGPIPSTDMPEEDMFRV